MIWMHGKTLNSQRLWFSMNFFLSQLIVSCNLKQEFHYTGLLLYLIMTIFDSSSPPRNIRKLTSWKMGANTKMKCS